MLEELKQQVLDLSQKTERSGLCVHKAGNFSLRDRESGLIVMTPSALDRMTARVEDICVLSPSGEIAEIKKGLKPSSEGLLHLRVYALRSDVGAVVHTHSRYATAMAVLRKSIPPVLYEVALYGGKVPVAPYGRPGTKDLADSINDIIPCCDVCLLAAHGVLSTGVDAEDAYLKALHVEEAAAIYHMALCANGGKEPPLIPQEELDAWEYPKEISI